ncbi:hypothetical protein Bbelb_224770 [Branchiostoma belcheri]|nr:hypothetical protein Bbelb_224770 [Branchiostoma belcheri]
MGNSMSILPPFPGLRDRDGDKKVEDFVLLGEAYIRKGVSSKNGSLAREEMTPYSDLEFAVLLEERERLDNEKAYFRSMTYLLHLKVLNLGETILPSMCIEELNDYNDMSKEQFYDSVTPHGFSFDGCMPWASKTPLGRDETDTKPGLELIMTPREMADVQTMNRSLREGYHLADVLRTATLIKGDQSLVDEYRQAVFVILDSPVSDVDNTTVGQKMALQTLSEDVNLFDPTALHDPSRSGFGLLFGCAYDYNKAEECFLDVLKDNPGNRVALWNLLQIYALTHRYSNMKDVLMNSSDSLSAISDVINDNSIDFPGLLATAFGQNPIRLRERANEDTASDGSTEHSPVHSLTEGEEDSAIMCVLKAFLPAIAGDFAEAESSLEQVMKIKEKWGSDEEPSSVYSRMAHTIDLVAGGIYFNLKNYEKCVFHLELGLKYLQTLYGSHSAHPLMSYCFLLLSRSHKELSNHEMAKAMMENARTCSRASLSRGAYGYYSLGAIAISAMDGSENSSSRHFAEHKSESRTDKPNRRTETSKLVLEYERLLEVYRLRYGHDCDIYMLPFIGLLHTLDGNANPLPADKSCWRGADLGERTKANKTDTQARSS